MRVAGITALGEPVEILEVDELAPPAADEVLIDVAAAGVGNWDELVRIGNWRVGGPAPKPVERFPFRRSPRLRHLTRLSGSRAAAGSSSTEPAESRVACSSSSPLLGAPA